MPQNGPSRGVSSLHVTFAPEDEWQFLGACGFLQRTDQQFHFLNEGYRDFEDFLTALASRKRKVIRRERRCQLTYFFDEVGKSFRPTALAVDFFVTVGDVLLESRDRQFMRTHNASLSQHIL